MGSYLYEEYTSPTTFLTQFKEQIQEERS